jgi:trehalose synthase
MTSTVSSARLDDYRQVAPRGAVDLLLRLGERLRGRRLVHVSASRYRGQTIEVLNRLVPILNDLGIDAGWEVTIGTSDFEGIARTVGRALTGTEQVVTDAMLERLRDVCAENAKRLRLEADLVVVHDAAPLLLVEGRSGDTRWVWRYHHDLSSPQPQLWNVLRPVAQRYDAVVFSDAKFAAPLSIPRFVIYPSVDPLSERNRDMGRAEQGLHLDRLRVPRDKPFLLQVGPFHRSHDPLGVINAYRLVKKHHDVRLVLAGPPPGSGDDVLAEVQEAASHDPDLRIVVLPPDPQTEVNALERSATIVIHKPLATGFGIFGINVAAAMWKGKPVLGSLAGGIPNQVIFGVTGYTVETVEGAAFRIRHLLGNPELIGRMGAAAREHIRRNFLITRHIGDYLALLALLTK